MRTPRPLKGAQRRGNWLRFGGGTGSRGASLSLGLKLRGDPLGGGLLGHRALGLGTLGGRALCGGPLGGGALGCEPFGRGTLRCGPLRRGALGFALGRGARGERALRFRAHLRRHSLRLGAFRCCALCCGVLRRCEELLRGALFLGSASLLDRSLHRGALLSRATVFLRPSLLR